MKKQFALFTQVFNFEVFKLIFEQLNLHGANQMVKSHYVSLSAFLFEEGGAQHHKIREADFIWAIMRHKKRGSQTRTPFLMCYFFS